MKIYDDGKNVVNVHQHQYVHLNIGTVLNEKTATIVLPPRMMKPRHVGEAAVQHHLLLMTGSSNEVAARRLYELYAPVSKKTGTTLLSDIFFDTLVCGELLSAYCNCHRRHLFATFVAYNTCDNAATDHSSGRSTRDAARSITQAERDLLFDREVDELVAAQALMAVDHKNWTSDGARIVARWSKIRSHRRVL